MTQASLHAAVQSKVGDSGQLGFKQVMLHDVQHALELAEYKHSVLPHHSLGAALRAGAAPAQATVQKQLVRVEKKAIGNFSNDQPEQAQHSVNHQA